jgi:predicted N-acyltransferase
VFEDYLNIFTSKQRKNIKTERRKIKNAGITFITKDYDSITEEDWDDFYLFYKNTYAERMQAPYLNRQFFKHINRDKKALKPVLFFAVYENRKIAGSLCFQGEDTLYGRHWGAFENIDNLHFECCYYQGIDYCIKNNIKYFDPGVQGEHKIRRGFEPQSCDSYHYVLQEDFRDAIKNFCYEESKSVESYLRACQEYTPIKKEYRI